MLFGYSTIASRDGLISRKTMNYDTQGTSQATHSITARLLTLSLVLISPYLYAQPNPLPAYGADLNQSSVSGLSSGAFMTSQLYVAFSELMVGAGVIAGGPYLCAKSWAGNTLLTNATTTCMNPLTASVGPNTPELVKQAQKLSESGAIAPLSNLADDRVYIFSGTEDKTVTTTVVDQTYAFFKSVGIPDSSIRYDKSVNAGHAIVVTDTTTACPLTQPPFINDCDFEQSNRILSHIYPELKPATTQNPESLIAFDQSEFLTLNYTSMSKTGYVYIPKNCQAGQKSCSVHIVFHGCQQGAEVIGDQYYAKTGYNELAEANDLIVLYPQITPSNTIPFNPQGCWDFWGYSSPGNIDPDYYTRSAPQLSAVYKMLQRLATPAQTNTVPE